MGEAVHFRGQDAIVKAYESNDVPAFAVVQGKDLLYQYTGDNIEEGSQLLAGMIEMLTEGHSTGIYQIRMYRRPPEDITLKDKFNFSFKCRLMTDEVQDDDFNANSVMGRRLKAIEDRMAAADADVDDEPEAPGWQARLGSILDRPDVQNYLLPKIFGFVDKLFGVQPRPAATVGSVPEEANPAPSAEQTPPPADSSQLYLNLPADQRASLDEAMGILLQMDPSIGTNLLKCARLLQTNPVKYRMAVAML